MEDYMLAGNGLDPIAKLDDDLMASQASLPTSLISSLAELNKSGRSKLDHRIRTRTISKSETQSKLVESVLITEPRQN